MFHSISEGMQAKMAELEAIDTRDREDGTPKAQRLRQVPPETGRFLAIIAASAPQGPVLELGASGGYSGMWLALACMQRGDRLLTHELDEAKIRRAQASFDAAGVSDHVRIIPGDALQSLQNYDHIAFCFIDFEKELYQTCYDMVVPRLVPGGFLLADNVISHQDQLQGFVEQALADRRVDALVVPVGKGVLMCRKSAD
jgi:caffeoyl-CoA O-methyltransferase